MHFAKLVDRWVQNRRRGAGFKVQYFAAIEPQRRLAPHVYVAMRGAIERQRVPKLALSCRRSSIRSAEKYSSKVQQRD